jgi:hypothetical protein
LNAPFGKTLKSIFVLQNGFHNRNNIAFSPDGSNSLAYLNKDGAFIMHVPSVEEELREDG